MNGNFSWYEFEEGASIGQTGSEGGVIIRDEEHADGARITLEEDCLAPFAITCGIYGWFVHSRFFDTESEAEEQFNLMKRELGEILESIPAEEEADPEELDEIALMIEDFVERYP